MALCLLKKVNVTKNPPTKKIPSPDGIIHWRTWENVQELVSILHKLSQ